MSETHAVTVGVDGSAPAIAALDWAAQYAQAHYVPLQVLTAVGWPGERPGYGGSQLAELKEAARIDGRRTLDRALKRVRAVLPQLAVSGYVSDEPPARALLAASESSGLIVVGCRGLNPTASVILGSVSAALTGHAKCPVVVVRSDPRIGPTVPPAAVVVGIDGSEADEATLGAAFAEADRRGAPLIVAHAWSDASLVGVFGAGAVPSWIEARQHAEALLQRQLAAWRPKYPDVRVGTVVEREQPARMLLELARAAGLVVVGSHGRGGFAGMRLGSVARRLLHHADAPVLVVRRGARATAHSDAS